jgi:hypothetical protein
MESKLMVVQRSKLNLCGVGSPPAIAIFCRILRPLVATAYPVQRMPRAAREYLTTSVQHRERKHAAIPVGNRPSQAMRPV